MRVPFDSVHMRELLLNQKEFLKDLYSFNSYQNRKLIISADNQSLNTLLKILHLILNNEIPILEEDVNVIKKAKKLGLLKNTIKSNEKFIELLEGERKNKVDFLVLFSNVYTPLLRSIFEE